MTVVEVATRQIAETRVEATRGSGKNLALEGLRGLAALNVVLSHCFYAFFPHLHSGDPGQLAARWEHAVFVSPFRFLYNGTFAVAVFFVMSGYVLSQRYIAQPDIGYIQQAAAKRYIRLGVPVLAAVLTCYALMCCGAYPGRATGLQGFLPSAYQFSPSLKDAIKDGVVGALFAGEARYDYVLWTIRVEFFGSLLLFAFLGLFGSLRIAGACGAVVAATLVWLMPETGVLYALFIAGAALHWCRKVLDHRIVTLLLVSAGLYLGGYHWNSPVYRWMVDVAALSVRHSFTLEWPLFFVSIGAVFLVAGIVSENPVSRFLSRRVPVWLGDLSFSLYLTHTFALSSAGAFVFMSVRGSYQTRTWMATASVVFVSLALAWFFARLIDAPTVRLASRFSRWCTPSGATE